MPLGQKNFLLLWSKPTHVAANGNHVHLGGKVLQHKSKYGRKQEKTLLPPACCTWDSHMKRGGCSPGSARVLWQAAWEVQPFGTVVCLWESSCSSAWLLIQLPWKDATERVATLTCDLDKCVAQSNCKMVGLSVTWSGSGSKMHW